MQLALYQPDIPQNVGAIMRTSACFGVNLHIIEPCGFVFDEPKIRRAAMDYIDHVTLIRHASFEAFMQHKPAGRLVLFSTKAATALDTFSFEPTDTLMFGRESAGVPEEVASSADARVIIPMRQGLRSLNVAQSVAIGLYEACKQTGCL